MSNPTLQTAKGPSSKPPTQQRRRQGPQQTAPLQLTAGKLVLGPPVAQAATAVLGANIPRAKPGNGVSRHWMELGVQGTHPWRTDAAPSGDLRCARHRQPDESLFD
jgi:hypothetical protein